MINRKYWRAFFQKAVNEQDQNFIEFLLKHDCKIDNDIFTNIIELPNLDSEILILAINAKYEFKSYNLQHIIELYPHNKQAIEQSIKATDEIAGHLLDFLTKLEDIDYELIEIILKKTELLEACRLPQILELAKGDQELVQLGLNKLQELLPDHLKNIIELPQINYENISLAIEKVKNLKHYNLQDLLKLDITGELVLKAIQKTDQLLDYNLQELIQKSFTNFEILKSALLRTQEIADWNYLSILSIPDLSLEIIRLAFNKLVATKDLKIIESFLENIDYINENNFKIILESGHFEIVASQCVPKLKSNMTRQEFRDFVSKYQKTNLSDLEDIISPDHSNETSNSGEEASYLDDHSGFAHIASSSKG